MIEEDIDFFNNEFLNLGWGDRSESLRLYYNEQDADKRNVLVAEYKQMPAGYLTLVPNAVMGPFAGKNIPEVVDFNVLPQYRRLGIGSHLMDSVEDVAKTKSTQITLGVGLYSDYGSAQRMYAKRGYIPDGSGIWYGDKNLTPGETCINDDDLNLYFSKQL